MVRGLDGRRWDCRRVGWQVMMGWSEGKTVGGLDGRGWSEVRRVGS
jgi:hypothetical protein